MKLWGPSALRALDDVPPSHVAALRHLDLQRAPAFDQKEPTESRLSVEQSRVCLFVVRTCCLPLLVWSLAASYGILGLQSGAIFSVLGAEERMGALVGRFG